MKEFIDRRYFILVSLLDKVRKSLLCYYEKLKNMESKINKDSQIKVIIQELENY